MPSVPLLVDAHVHFHHCFDRNVFLDAALANFRRGAEELALGGSFLGCLLLAEMTSERALQRLRGGEDGRWQFEPTAEPSSLIARRSADGERLLVIAGRQVRTREGLEILALLSTEEFPDGLAFRDALTRVRWSGAVPVLPWGFGKWWFYRGALIEGLLRRPEPKWLFLGDNGGRPEFGGSPRLLREAGKRGVPVLPGSDPLPLPEHANRAGSCGFLMRNGVEERQPAAALRRWLRDLAEQPPTFGGCQSLTRFCRDQLALRLRRRPRVPAPSPAGRPAAHSTWTP
ncbi:MAG TPA: hypothetical protein VIW92_12285 [Thermoanaerobaculia bacterium]